MDALDDAPGIAFNSSSSAVMTGNVFAGLGGGVGAYGEWNSTAGQGTPTRVVKTVAVGAADTAVNVSAGEAGSAAGGLMADALMGTEAGMWVGPEGAVVGAAAGAVVGGVVAFAGSNVVNHAVDSEVDTAKSTGPSMIDDLDSMLNPFSGW